MLLTFAFACCGWVFFRARTLADAGLIFRKIFADAFDLDGYFLALMRVEDQPLGRLVFVALALLVITEWLQRREAHPLAFPRWPGPLRWAAYFALTVTIVFAGTFGSNEFIYFQF